MQTANKILLSRSTPVVNALSKLIDVKAILCFGSYAMDTFDQYSDIDLYALCHPEITASSARRDVLQKIEGINEYVEVGWEEMLEREVEALFKLLKENRI